MVEGRPVQAALGWRRLTASMSGRVGGAVDDGEVACHLGPPAVWGVAPGRAVGGASFPLVRSHALRLPPQGRAGRRGRAGRGGACAALVTRFERAGRRAVADAPGLRAELRKPCAEEAARGRVRHSSARLALALEVVVAGFPDVDRRLGARAFV